MERDELAELLTDAELLALVDDDGHGGRSLEDEIRDELEGLL